jgi:hypothetical protein
MPSGPLMNRLNWFSILSHIHKDIPLPSSKIKNILACSLGPQMGWIEEKNGLKIQ